VSEPIFRKGETLRINARDLGLLPPDAPEGEMHPYTITEVGRTHITIEAKRDPQPARGKGDAQG
jgi:hypothetical protein